MIIETVNKIVRVSIGLTSFNVRYSVLRESVFLDKSAFEIPGYNT